MRIPHRTKHQPKPFASASQPAIVPAVLVRVRHRARFRTPRYMYSVRDSRTRGTERSHRLDDRAIRSTRHRPPSSPRKSVRPAPARHSETTGHQPNRGPLQFITMAPDPTDSRPPIAHPPLGMCVRVVAVLCLFWAPPSTQNCSHPTRSTPVTRLGPLPAETVCTDHLSCYQPPLSFTPRLAFDISTDSSRWLRGHQHTYPIH